MPQMQPEPTWTPYGVQTPQPQVQIPPISPMYAPTSFTQQYGPQYSQPQYTQPQTAWTIPPQPAPGQQVYVTQPAQPVYIQPAPQPVYQAVPAYPAPQSAPAAPAAPAPAAPAPAAPVPAAPAAPAVPEAPKAEAPAEPPKEQPVPAPAPAPVKEEPAPQPVKEESIAEPNERVLAENIVATVDHPADEPPKYEANLFEEMEREPDENGRYPEKFFTFNKKNEEFQQLLNKEYERLRGLHNDDTFPDLSRTSVYRKESFEPTPAQNFFHDDDLSSDLSEFEKMLMESTKDSSGDETLAINRDRIKGAALTAEDLIEPLTHRVGDTHPFGEAPVPAEEPAAEPAEEKVQEPAESPAEAAKSEHQKKMEAMAKAREAYFASLRSMTAEMRAMTAEMKAVKDAEFKQQLKEEARIKTPEEIAAEKAEAERLAAEKEAAERAAAIEQAKAEMQAAREAHEKELGLDSLDEAVAAPAEKSEEEVQPAAEEPAAEPEKETAEAEAKEEPKKPERNKTEAFGELLDDVDEETKKKEKREHSHWFLKFLLALLIVAGAAEGATIALRNYAPDSPASIITTSIEQNVIQFCKTAVDSVKAKFQKDTPAEETPAEPQETPDASAFVLADLIAENNKNIETVVENLAIGYDSQRTYDIPGLASSQLVTDNAEKAEVCKTLIAYNSSWIDFINGTNQDWLDFLKADGTAYRSAVTFDKIGQITENFKRLEIGEIRKTEDAYFAFAGETIEVTENEATAQSSGFMVYELVPVGDALKIKDYYNITN